MLQPLDALLGGAGIHRYAENAAHAGAYRVGVEQIRGWIGYDDGINTSSIGSAHHSTEISGFLHGFQHDDQGVFPRFKLFDALIFRNGNCK